MKRFIGTSIAVVFLAAFFVFSFSAISSAAEPGDGMSDLWYGYKGVKWGATKDEFRKLRPDTVFVDGEAQTEEVFLGYKAHVRYLFNDDKRWYGILVNYKDDEDESVYNALENKYINTYGIPSDRLAHWTNNNVEVSFKDVLGLVVYYANDYDEYSGPIWKDLGELIDKGNAFKKAKEYEKALECYNEATKIKKNYRPAYQGRAEVYTEEKKYDEAIQEYTNLINIDPEYTDGFSGRGLIYFQTKQYEKALADRLSALERSPKYKETFYYGKIGEVYFEMKDYPKAVEAFTAAILHDTDGFFISGAYKNRAYTYLAQGKQKEAIDDFSKVIELDPNNAANYNTRAWTYYEMGQYDKGLPDIDKALKLKPDVAGYLDTRSNIYRGLGKYSKAMDDINRAIELKPDKSYYYYTRGLNYQAMGEEDKALADLKKSCDMGQKEACDEYAKLNK
ncbi:MAG: tetratricopeptide repeat protein [Deltaproteobacteria bacterium]|nr:tetratricopeptide repeat protein [Candidatus Zymogenaceae bacterium]